VSHLSGLIEMTTAGKLKRRDAVAKSQKRTGTDENFFDVKEGPDAWKKKYSNQREPLRLVRPKREISCLVMCRGGGGGGEHGDAVYEGHPLKPSSCERGKGRC